MCSQHKHKSIRIRVSHRMLCTHMSLLYSFEYATVWDTRMCTISLIFDSVPKPSLKTRLPNILRRAQAWHFGFCQVFEDQRMAWMAKKPMIVDTTSWLSSDHLVFWAKALFHPQDSWMTLGAVARLGSVTSWSPFMMHPFDLHLISDSQWGAFFSGLVP